MIRAFLLALALLSSLPAAPMPPLDPHNPGSAVYHYRAIRTQVTGAGGFGLVYYVPHPTDAQAHPGPYPVLIFGHGKQLYGGSLLAPSQPLDLFYAALLEHIARKGYVVIFPQFEAGLLDGDRLAQADRYLAALRWVHDHLPIADMSRVVFAGHSMGADVALLAASLVARGKTQGPQPRAVLAFAPVDEPVVRSALSTLPAGCSITMITGDADTIAPATGVVDLARAISGHRHQVIEISSDPDVSPPLIADHNLSLTGGNLPAMFGGIPTLNALDWYGSWKLSAALLDYTFRAGSATWIWGTERLYGGVDSAGHHLHYRALVPPII